MSTLITGEAVSIGVRPASLMSRALSCAIDYVVYWIIYLAYFFGLVYVLADINVSDSLLATTVTLLSTIFVLVAVPCTVEFLTRGRSLGKLIMGLRIVRDDGGAISFRHVFLRSLMWQFEVLATGGGVAAASGLFSSDTKRLGDHLAGTIAVTERARLPRPYPVTVPEELIQWVRDADISPIPSPLFYRAAQFLTTAHLQTPDSRRARAIELATELNPYTAPAPPEGTQPEGFIAAIVDYQRWDGLRRAERAQASAEAFGQRLGTLPHGLRLDG